MFTLVIAIALAAAMAMYLALRGHHRGLTRIEEIEASTSPVNLKCFARITDINEQQFLKSMLPPNAFRRIQRERVLISIQYVRLAARNASVLIRIGEIQSGDSNIEIRERAKKLVEESFQLRLVCLVAIVMLCISFVFPEQNISIFDLIAKYESMSDSLGLLGMATNPLLASRARTWL
jgi:hypothetical protein